MKISFMGCDVLEGYGLTEACAFGTRAWSYDDATATGTIGGAAAFEELKLVAVPELRYTAQCPRRGVTTSSVGITKTRKQLPRRFDKDRWFHAGAVAELD